MKTRLIFLIALVLLAALTRLLPHPQNFAPITAMALFGAAYFDRKALAFFVPMAALFLSDIGLEITHSLGLTVSRGFHLLMPVIYGTFMLITLMGFWLRGRTRFLNVAGTTLAGSVVFFVVTNFAVWALLADAPQPEGYPKTWSGLVECYVNALPYFRWTLLGDAVYSTALFGGYALAVHRWPVLRRKEWSVCLLGGESNG